MKDTFYFTHDYNARNDPKIIKLLMKLGLEGYGIYWAIVENLYQNANALPSDYDSIAYMLRTDSEKIKSVINDFELFVFDNGKFGSLSVGKRLEERNSKSKKASDSARFRWKKEKEEMRTHSERNANLQKSDAIKERKGKEMKGNTENTEYNNNNPVIEKNLLRISGFEKLSEDKKSICFSMVSNEKTYMVVDDEFLNSGIITFLDKEKYLNHREATSKKFKVPDVFYFSPNQMKFYSFYDLIFYMTSDESFLDQIKITTQMVKPDDIKSWIRFYAEHAFTSNERNSIQEMKKHIKFSWSSIPGQNFKNLKLRSQ